MHCSYAASVLDVKKHLLFGCIDGNTIFICYQYMKFTAGASIHSRGYSTIPAISTISSTISSTTISSTISTLSYYFTIISIHPICTTLRLACGSAHHCDPLSSLWLCHVHCFTSHIILSYVVSADTSLGLSENRSLPLQTHVQNESIQRWRVQLWNIFTAQNVIYSSKGHQGLDSIAVR